jgi:hypothetical protein
VDAVRGELDRHNKQSLAVLETTSVTGLGMSITDEQLAGALPHAPRAAAPLAR